MVTFPLASSVNLPALVDGVIHHKDTFSKTIAWAESPLVQSTGGELVRLDDGFFYLIGGHVFTGSYRSFEAADEKTSPKASQTYLGEIRKLRFNSGRPGKIDVTLVESFKDPEFARRDLNASPTILADGKSLGAAAYGGVFTKDQLNFTHPIFVAAGSVPKADESYEQKMSAYSCATLLLYDPESSGMYTTFFGGISPLGQKKRLAMVIDETPQFAGWEIHILATDVSAHAIERATSGLFSEEEVQRGLPLRLLSKYFRKEPSGWRISDELRNRVELRVFNLMDCFAGLGMFDVIFCRNVLMYLDPEAKSDILERLAGSLERDGYLVLGAAETMLGACESFTVLPHFSGIATKARRVPDLRAAVTTL